MRLFIALTPTPGLARQVTEWMRSLELLSAGMRPVRTDTLHLTLRFLGETDPARLDAVAAAMDRTVAGVAPYDLALGGTGSFPSERNARVLWLSLVKGESETRTLAAALERELAKGGFPPEQRAFHPHLTVARWRVPPDRMEVLQMIEAGANFKTGPVPVTGITLYQSELRPEGPAHIPLRQADW